MDSKFIWRVKWGTAALITLVNISVYCIWIPARLQISPMYIHINSIWDRCEKVIYLLVDAALNFLFMRIVRHDLVQYGLHKYNGLVRFNMFIIGFSLSMDVLIISMMSLRNTFVYAIVDPSISISLLTIYLIDRYMQFHPLAYIVKLNIEMSMASLIGKIARATEQPGAFDLSGSGTRTIGEASGDAVIVENNRDECTEEGHRAWAAATTAIQMNSLKIPEVGEEIQRRSSHHADSFNGRTGFASRLRRGSAPDGYYRHGGYFRDEGAV